MLSQNLHTIDISNLDQRFLSSPKFSDTPLDISLSQHVLVFNNGKRWKIIPISLASSFPVIHDQFYDRVVTKQSKPVISNISLTFCPFSSSAIIFFGRFVPTKLVYNNNLVFRKQNHPDSILLQLLGNLYSKQTGSPIHSLIRRHEVRIMTLRNAISRYPDPHFLHHSHTLSPIVDCQYSSNSKILFPLLRFSSTFHPKTLVLGIEYQSKHVDQFNLRHAVIVGDDSSSHSSNSYDQHVNKYYDYINQHVDHIRKKGGIFIFSYWFAWFSMFPNSKVIKL